MESEKSTLITKWKVCGGRDKDRLLRSPDKRMIPIPIYHNDKVLMSYLFNGGNAFRQGISDNALFDVL